MATQQNAQLSRDEQVSELLLRWQEFRQQGRHLTAEELCADCPELVAELRQQIQALESMEAILGLGHEALAEAPAAAGLPSTPLPGEAKRSAELRVPIDALRLPGYEILEVLGEGGMGIVYKARQLGLNRLVAIKMILAGPHARPEQLARFRTEVEAVAQLRHPHIVQIYEVGEWRAADVSPPMPYFSMEFVDGGNLAQKLSTTLLPVYQAAQLVETLAGAIHSAHQHGIIHRDLKPANVLLASGGREPPEESLRSGGSRPPLAQDTPKITDFGLAKQLKDEKGQTQTGAIMGTPSYLSPEQAEGKTREIGPATDIYALGAILYEMLTGRPPFQGESTLDILEQVRLHDPIPPSRFQRKVPCDLDTICLKCLEKEPGKRYPSAGHLADDLRRFLAGQPILARPAPLWEQGVKWAKRKPALAALLAVTAAALLTLLAGWAVFTAELHTERNLAEQQRHRAEEQEQLAQQNLKIAEEGWRYAERQRDEANEQRQRAQAILVRCLTAVDAHAKATEQGRQMKNETGEQGSIFYVLGRFYAATAADFAKDTKLTLEDRQKLAEEYASNAVKQLEKARSYRYFHVHDNFQKLKRDTDLDALRSRPDFQKLLVQVEKERKERGD
jgi:serine/threonine protein kinase